MSSQEKKAQQKALHESLKNIRARIKAGQPTTFSERNFLKMQDKKKRKP